MADRRYDVLTIGNAIVDIIASVPDGFLGAEGIGEGLMHLIDEERAEALFSRMPRERRIVPGGSAGNTAAGVVSLGGQAAFVGKLAEDDLGDVYAAEFARTGIDFRTLRLVGGPATARSMIFVSPGGERTMNTHLGACHALSEADIDEAQIGAATLTYMEGFLWDPIEAKKAFVKAAHFAHKHERAAAFTLSDPSCVDRYRVEFRDLLASRTIDYVFANVAELKALYETEDFGTAVRAIAGEAELAAITMGADGAMVIADGEIVTVPAFAVPEVVDATGAGDLFAAGFLFGHARGAALGRSLELGCLAAAEVISHYGARPEDDLAARAAARGLSVPET